MANNCSTCHKIFGDKEEIAKFYEKLSNLQQINSEYYQKWCKARREDTPLPEYPPEITQNTCCLWLGDIVSHFGGDNESVPCRGTMDTLELMSDNVIWIVTDTAWCPMPEVWDVVLKDYPSLKFYYLAEECGCEIYINSDPTGEYFDELYYIDDCGGDGAYVSNDEDLFSDIAVRLEVEKIESFEELDRLLEAYNEEHEDDGIYYHKFTEPND
ncbi:MAG: hypothetical protein SNJ29_08800 [Rikenellaceae bacterium]